MSKAAYKRSEKAKLQGGPKKANYCQMIKKSYYIVSKPVNEIRFIRQLEV